MTKPIVVIKMPDYATDEAVFKMGDDLSKGEIKNDYHVFMFKTNLKEVNVQVYYEKDFNKVKFEELKDIIEKSVVQDES